MKSEPDFTARRRDHHTYRDNGIEVRVRFPTRFLPGYTYNYDFDYTAKSMAFLTIK